MTPVGGSGVSWPFRVGDVAVGDAHHHDSPFILPAVAGAVVRHTESLCHASDALYDTHTDRPSIERSRCAVTVVNR